MFLFCSFARRFPPGRALFPCLVLSLALPTRLAASPQILTVAGTGTMGFSGDGGKASEARLNNPFGITRGPGAAFYICDTGNHVIRRVDAQGIISTIAGSGKRGYSGDGGPAVNARLNEPYEVRFDAAGNMFFVERMNHLIRRVDAKTKMISTVAGCGHAGFSGDDGPATKAVFSEPHSIQFDRKGDLYICDIGNQRIRKIEMRTGVISTFAGTGDKRPTPDGANITGTPLHGPRAIDFDNAGDLWLALREGNAIFQFDLNAGVIHHVAGTGRQGFAGNGGAAVDAALSGPKGIAVGPEGHVYFADTESHSIRMIDRAKRTVELIAGTGEKGSGPEPDPLQCHLSRPHGIFVDRDGSIFIGDTEAHRVRVIRAFR